MILIATARAQLQQWRTGHRKPKAGPRHFNGSTLDGSVGQSSAKTHNFEYFEEMLTTSAALKDPIE
ncbi:hypothetical protein [Variovorax sp. E3]|uniref:hypothetical protein n=1 Tax=Variovorax sp. E3 TaxID=1914993 RepID=UPI0018DCC75A|nr:hypothetical protein [Variovorax sp. E3]